MKETIPLYEQDRKNQAQPLFSRFSEASFDEYEKAISAFLKKENPDADEGSLQELVEEDILEMVEWLEEPFVDQHVREIVISTTEKWWKLTNVDPEDAKPETLEFTNIQGEVKKITLVFDGKNSDDLLQTLES